MSDNPTILDGRFTWGENTASGSRDTIHLVDFDSDNPIGMFRDHPDRSLCGHWLDFDADDEPSADRICVNCLRSGLSKGVLDADWAMDMLDSATDITQRGVEASPPN